jgi:hypothetical protein
MIDRLSHLKLWQSEAVEIHIQSKDIKTLNGGLYIHQKYA